MTRSDDLRRRPIILCQDMVFRWRCCRSDTWTIPPAARQSGPRLSSYTPTEQPILSLSCLPPMKSTAHKEESKSPLDHPLSPIPCVALPPPRRSSFVHEVLTLLVHPDVIPLVWAYAATIDGLHLIRTLSVQGDRKGISPRWSSPPSFIIDDNEIFMCDSSNHQVEVFNVRDGKHLRRWGSINPSSGYLTTPVSITVTNSEVFVAEQRHTRVEVYDRSTCKLVRTIVVSDRDGGLSLTGLCIDGLELLVTTAGPDQVFRFNKDTGVCWGTFGNLTTLRYPHSISLLQDSYAVSNADASFVTLFHRDVPHEALQKIDTLGFKALALTACGDQLIMSGLQDPTDTHRLVSYNRSSQSLDSLPSEAPGSNPWTPDWSANWRANLHDLYDVCYYDCHLFLLFQNASTTKIVVME